MVWIVVALAIIRAHRAEPESTPLLAASRKRSAGAELTAVSRRMPARRPTLPTGPTPSAMARVLRAQFQPALLWSIRHFLILARLPPRSSPPTILPPTHLNQTAIALDPFVVTSRLDQAREDLVPSLGATAFQIRQDPDRYRNPRRQRQLLAGCCCRSRRSPGFVRSGHVRGEHADLQYRINDVLLPKAQWLRPGTRQPVRADHVYSHGFIAGAIRLPHRWNRRYPHAQWRLRRGR